MKCHFKDCNNKVDDNRTIFEPTTEYYGICEEHVKEMESKLVLSNQK